MANKINLYNSSAIYDSMVKDGFLKADKLSKEKFLNALEYNPKYMPRVRAYAQRVYGMSPEDFDNLVYTTDYTQDVSQLPPSGSPDSATSMPWDSTPAQFSLPYTHTKPGSDNNLPGLPKHDNPSQTTPQPTERFMRDFSPENVTRRALANATPQPMQYLPKEEWDKEISKKEAIQQGLQEIAAHSTRSTTDYSQPISVKSVTHPSDLTVGEWYNSFASDTYSIQKEAGRIYQMWQVGAIDEDEARSRFHQLYVSPQTAQSRNFVRTIDERRNFRSNNAAIDAAEAEITSKLQAAAAKNHTQPIPMPYMGDARISDSIDEQYYKQSLRFLDDARKISRAYADNNYNGTSTAQRVLRGIGDNLITPEAITMGFSAIADNANLMRILEKDERGEQLSDAEETLLSAAIIKQYTEAAYASGAGIAYNIGAVTGESLPYMLSFVVTGIPVKAATSGISKRIVNFVGRQLQRKGIGRIATRATKATLGLGGNIATSALQAPIMPSTYSDYLDRRIGTIDSTTDGMGNIRFSHQGDSRSEAALKAYFNTFYDNFGERSGEAISSLWGMFGRGIGKIPIGRGKSINDIFDTIHNSRLGKFWDTMQGTAVADFMRQANYDGVFAEVVEEYISGILNAATIGDQSFEELFSQDNLLTTMGGIALTSVMLGSANATLGVAATQRIRSNFNRSSKAAQQYFSPEQFNQLISISGGSVQDITTFLAANIARRQLIARQISQLANRQRNGETGIEAQINTLGAELQDLRMQYDFVNASAMYNAYIGGLSRRIEPMREQAHKAIRANGDPATGLTIQVDVNGRQGYLIGGNYNHIQDSDGNISVTPTGDLATVLFDGDKTPTPNIPMETISILGVRRTDDVIRDGDRAIFAATEQEENAAQAPATGSTVTVSGSQGNFILQGYDQQGNAIVTPLNSDGTPAVKNGNPITASVPSENIIPEEAGNTSSSFRTGSIAYIDGIPYSIDQVDGENAIIHRLNTDGTPVNDEQGNPITSIVPTATLSSSPHPAQTVEPQNVPDEQQPTPEQQDAGQDAAIEETNTQQQPAIVDDNITETPSSALSRIPKDKKGKPIYEQSDPETAYDAIIEQAEGDTALASRVILSMIDNKEAALNKLSKAKPRRADNPADIIKAEKELAAQIKQAQSDLQFWKNTALVPSLRNEAQKEAEANSVIQDPSLADTPDITDDSPSDARKRGFRRYAGSRIDRSEPLNTTRGNAAEIRFSAKQVIPVHAAVIEADEIIPSHINGQRNPKHFLDEAQPKERTDQASVMAARQIAADLRPEEITSLTTAYSGAPVINARGEVIQGNNRSAALREMWSSYPEQAARYRQYLIDHAAQLGIDPASIQNMKAPVLVAIADVSDQEAIRLGQYTQTDLESGGTERIKPQNAITAMGNNVKNFANILLQSTDENASLSELLDRNALAALKWMQAKGYITPTQYQSAVDARGNVTAEAKNDLRNILFSMAFKGAAPQLRSMFDNLPARAQRAILTTAYRDMENPEGESFIPELQNSIRAFHYLMQYPAFAAATNYKDARSAIEAWKRQFAIDDVTGDSFLPAEKFSNFALILAASYKGCPQSLIQNIFTSIYDIIQGSRQPNLFDTLDNTPKSLQEAINTTIQELLPQEHNFNYNGTTRSNLLAGNSATSQQPRQGSDGTSSTGERAEGRNGTTLSTAGAQSNGRQKEITPNLFQYFTGSLSELIEQAKQSAQGLIKKVIAPVSSRLKNDLNSQGLQINDDYNHVIDNHAIRHTLKKHSGKNEEKRGQIPITDADFENIADVVEHYDGVEVVQGKTSAQRIIYHKAYQDGTIIFVEEQRVGRKELAAVTMWKKKNPNLTDANRTETTLISDLTEVSENKDNISSPNSQTINENTTDKESNTEKEKGYTVERRFHKKNGTYIHAVKFTEQMPRERFMELKKHVKDFGGYYSSFGKGGFIFEDEADAHKFANAVLDENGKRLSDATPVYLADTRKASDTTPEQPKQVDAIGIMEEIREKGEAELSDHVIESSEQKKETSALHETNPGGNRIVSEERYIELRERMRKKLGGQLNMGIDPEMIAIGAEMAVYHIEKGARKFAEYAKAMIADLGDAIRPYLKVFYNAARDLNQEFGYNLDGIEPYDVVMKFDVANFDKPTSDPIEAAETVVKEQKLQQELQEVKQKEKQSQNNEPKSFNGYKVGDKVLYTPSQRSGKPVEAVIHDFENEGEHRPVLDTGLTPLIYEVVDWGDIKPVTQKETTERPSKSRKKSLSSQKKIADLFGGLFDNENLTEKEEEHGLQRNNEVSSERLSADSDRHETRLSGSSEIGSEIQTERSRGIDSGRERGSYAVDRTVRPRFSDSVTTPKNTRNNHSERGVNHAPTSVDARIDANIKAIELANQLIENGENATPQQMEVLRKFSGWGGLGKAFSDTIISKHLLELIGQESYSDAVESANSGYYTPSYITDTLWDIAQQMGFEGGNILEGSAGIGNILGQIPQNINSRSNILAIEKDSITGNILSLLYPDANVEIQGFENSRIPNGSIDLAITNVPFITGFRVYDTTGDKDLSKKFHNIQDFCIAKNVRKLREGGIGIFISSNGTLDNSKKLRDWIVNEGGSDFVGAFRLNNKTFVGTSVTSDIIVIRKRVNGRKSPYAIDASTIAGERTADYDTGETRKVKGQEVPIVKHLSMDYNRYFIEHPENMAGEMRFAFEEGDTFRPTSKGLYPVHGKSQEKMLADFVKSFAGKEWTEEAGASKTSDPRNSRAYVMDVSADGKKLGEMYVKDGKLVIASAGGYYPLGVNSNKVKGHTKEECFNAYSAIKKALADVLEYQTNNESDNGLKPLLDRLNKAYDDFVATYGHFNKNTAIAFLRNDVDYPNVFSLEKFEERGDKSGNSIQTFEKSDVFSKRVVEKEKEPTPTNVKDGIFASMFKFGRIDIPYIAEQIGENIESVKQDIIDNGYGFEDPTTKQIEVSFQYLSGNVREKLRQAEENNENGIYDKNIKALQGVLPMEIPAHLIDFTLGSSWIDPKLYEEYVKERTDIDVRFTSVGGTWFMDAPNYGLNMEKNRSMGVVSETLHKTIFGHILIEAAIQNRTITVSQTNRKWDGTAETIIDKEATQACAEKIDEIRQDFKEWARQKMQNDTEMSTLMERIYNDTFNNYVPMTIPDEFVPEYFVGASHKFKMRPHQGKAIVRGTMQPLMLAHEVGTGKTFTLISTAMEMRRLGTARKPMIVVQNATVGQFVVSAKELYPNAKILTLEEADRSAEGRKNFYAKIRYNDWDMIVVPQSTFEFIPDSEERQMAFIQDKIEEKKMVLEQMKEADPDGSSMITRQAEREIELLEGQLAEITDEATKKHSASNQKKRAVTLQNAEVQAKEMLDRRTDDVENFDDMGIDALLIDEAHEYKHLGFATAMQRGVKGVDPSYSKKSQGVYLKTQAILEKNNGRNVIFATGTPISNTAAEIWTFMRYLMPADTMKEYGIYYFDDFVRNFGNIQQMLEFTTSGKFKENNRFSGYINLPELVRIWSGVSDTVLTREAEDVNDKIPEMEGGKAQDIYLPQTRALRGIMKFVKEQLDEFEKMSGKEKKKNSHIPLTMYGIAKAAAVDARLVQEDAFDDPNSKTNEAVRQTLRSLKETESYKGTVAIFADNYQNKQSGFNLYDDIRNKLIAEGIPAEQVVIMRPGMTIKKKLEIFDKVNRGDIRVILGSTFTLGTGVNIHERLHTLIHLDAPNRPMDYTQRNGRILRQGNIHKSMGKPVRILRFGVEDSLDVTAYQRLKTKGAIADSIMDGKRMMDNSMTNRVLEEEEDLFGDTVAQLSGSEYALLKNNAEKNVRKYESRKKQWEVDQTYIHNAKPKLKVLIAQSQQSIEEQKEYLESIRKAFPNGTFNEITIGKHTFTSIDSMADYIKEHNKAILDEVKKMKESGSSSGQTRSISISLGRYTFNVKTVLSRETVMRGGQLFTEVHRTMTYSCPELGLSNVPVYQSLLRNAIDDIINNVITGKDFAERIEAAERSAAHNRSELQQLESREGKPFEYQEELEQAKKQLHEYTEAMRKEMAEKEAKYAEIDASVETVENISVNEEENELSSSSTNILFRELTDQSTTQEQTNDRFNDELSRQIDGTLPKGHIYDLGMPSDTLLNAGLPNLPIEMAASRLSDKSMQENHPFDLSEIRNLPKAIQSPMAIFRSATRLGSFVVMTEIEHHGRNFVVAIQANRRKGRIEVNSIRSVHYRTSNSHIANWVTEGLLEYADKKRMVEWLSKQRYNSADVRKLFNHATNIIQNFDNPKNNNENIRLRDMAAEVADAARPAQVTRQIERLAREMNLPIEIIHSIDDIPDEYTRRYIQGEIDGQPHTIVGYYDRTTGKAYIILPAILQTADPLAEAERTILHEVIAHHGMQALMGRDAYDTLCDEVWQSLPYETRARFASYVLRKNPRDLTITDIARVAASPALRRAAADEYIAALAEGGVENPTLWQRIKAFFRSILRRMHLYSIDPTDADIRYLLSQARENLAQTSTESVHRGTDIRLSEKNLSNEEQEIIDRAKADGTYLKAPNGEETNLTPRQWVQVRTQAFKQWFGDWEKAARIEKLRHSKPVIVKYNEEYQLNRDSAKQWLKDNIRGEYANKDTGEKIIISKIGINEVTSHGTQNESHLKSLSAIPQMIENSVFIDELPNTKEHDKYDSYRYYVVGMKIDNVDYTAKIVVGVKGDSKYYDHRLTQIEKGTLIDNLNGLSNSVAENQNAHDSISKDSKLLSILQTNASKVVDTNGEPLVVYHGSRNFDPLAQEQGRAVFHQGNDGGIHFGTLQQAIIRGGDGNANAFFLNIRNIKRTADRDNHTSIIREAKKEGYDGTVYNNIFEAPGKSFVVFSPSQIKSATSNTGAFSSENPDIRYSYTEFNGRAMSLNAKSALENGKTDVGKELDLAYFIEESGLGTWNGEYHHVGKNYNRHYFVKLNDGVTLPAARKAFKKYLEDKRKAEIKAVLDKYPDAMTRQQVIDAGGRVFPAENRTHKDIAYAGGEYWYIPITIQEQTNDRFNDELQQQINGSLPEGHIYQLGRPGEILLSAGFPDMPIEMSATRLAEKSQQKNHPFDISAVRDLVKNMNDPIAVFKYGNNAKNVIIGIEYGGKQFLVGVHFTPAQGNNEVSSIRGIFPKDNAKWLNWISQGKADYLNKEEIQALIDKQRTNLADVEYLDLDSVTKIIQNFDNPKPSDTDIRFRELSAPEETMDNASRQGNDYARAARTHAAASIDTHNPDLSPVEQAEAVRFRELLTRDFSAASDFLNSANLINAAMQANDGKAAWLNNIQEAVFDSMLRLRLLLDRMKKDGASIPAGFNPYLAENQSRSRAQNRIAAFNEDYRRPLIETLAKCINKLREENIGVEIKDNNAAHEAISLYAQARAAVERQEVKEREAREQAKADGTEYKHREWAGLPGIQYAIIALYKGEITDDVEANKNNLQWLQDYAEENNIPTVEQYITMVEDALKKENIDNLWENIRRISEFQLTTSRDAGILSRGSYQLLTYGYNIDDIIETLYKEQRKKITDDINNGIGDKDSLAADLADLDRRHLEAVATATDLDAPDAITTLVAGGWITQDIANDIHRYYNYYLPLKGHAEITGEDLFDYNTPSMPRNASRIKSVRGHEQLARDPFNQILRDAEGCIVQAERNRWKQQLYHVLSTNRSLANGQYAIQRKYYQVIKLDDGTIRYEPYQRVVTTENNEDIITFVPTSEEIAAGTAVLLNSSAKFDIYVSQKQRSEHETIVYIDGSPISILFYDARIAKAVNGTNEAYPPQWMPRAIIQASRTIPALLTSWNPEFVLLSNPIRDTQEAIANAAIDKGFKYTAILARNLATVDRDLWAYTGGKLKQKKDNGQPLSQYEKYVTEFFENGGSVNVTQLSDYETTTKDLKKELKRALKGGKKPSKNFWKRLTEQTELRTRIATYITSRQTGSTIQDAINDAKEITVNFDRRGAQFRNFNLLQMFFNAQMQSVRRQTELMRRHPVRYATTVAILASSKVLIGLGISLLLGGGDDDNTTAEDIIRRYFEINKQLRTRNHIFIIDGEVYRIPVAPAFIPFTTLCEEAAQLAFDPSSRHRNTASQALLSVTSSVLETYVPTLISDPANIMINVNNAQAWRQSFASGIPMSGRALWQPFIEAIYNYDYTGNPIYTEPQFGAQHLPFHRDYRERTGKAYVYTSKLLSDLTGGNNVIPGKINIHPEQIEHVVQGLAGGIGTLAGRFAGIYKRVQGESTESAGLEFLYDIPFAARLYGGNMQQRENRYYQSLFFDDRQALEAFRAQQRFIESSKDMQDFNKEYNSDTRKYFYDFATADKLATKVRKWRDAHQKGSPEYKQYEAILQDIYRTTDDAYNRLQQSNDNEPYEIIDNPYYIYNNIESQLDKELYIVNGTFMTIDDAARAWAARTRRDKKQYYTLSGDLRKIAKIRDEVKEIKKLFKEIGSDYYPGMPLNGRQQYIYRKIEQKTKALSSLYDETEFDNIQLIE